MILNNIIDILDTDNVFNTSWYALLHSLLLILNTSNKSDITNAIKY
jgi:hypothetical protein